MGPESGPEVGPEVVKNMVQERGPRTLSGSGPGVPALPCPAVYPAVHPPVHHPGYTVLHHADTTATSMPAPQTEVSREDGLGSDPLLSLGREASRGLLGPSCHRSSEVLTGLPGTRTDDNG